MMLVYKVLKLLSRLIAPDLTTLLTNGSNKYRTLLVEVMASYVGYVMYKDDQKLCELPHQQSQPNHVASCQRLRLLAATTTPDSIRCGTQGNSVKRGASGALLPLGLQAVEQEQASRTQQNRPRGQEKVHGAGRVHDLGLLEHAHQQNHDDDVAQLGLEVVETLDREPRRALLYRTKRDACQYGQR